MANPAEIANIIALGESYDYWESVEIERMYGQPASYMTLTVAEIGDVNHGYKNLKLKNNDPAQGYLAGQLAANGVVDTRQVAYDPVNHSVQIRVASITENLAAS